MTKTRSARVVRIGSLLALLGALLVTPPAVAQPQTTCSFEDGTLRFDFEPSEGPFTLSRSGDSITLNAMSCGGTVTNTDLIQVMTVDQNKVATITIDLTHGPLAPGATAETGTSEIEVEIDVGIEETESGGQKFNELTVQGDAQQPNEFTFGDEGLNVNGDDDVDVTSSVFRAFDPLTLSGGNGDDVMTGTGGSGTGEPYDYPLHLTGGPGNDSLTGGPAADLFEGGPGADSFTGEQDVDGCYYFCDLVSYKTSPEAVNIDLAAGVITGGDATGDTYDNILGVVGSDFDDTLSGTEVSDGLFGGGGTDTLSSGPAQDLLGGGPGADTMDGGTGGADRAVYTDSVDPVTIDLEAGTNEGGDAAGDVFTSIEALEGSSGDDTLKGDGLFNFILGGPGEDVMEGRGGPDEFNQGHEPFGADVIDGGPGKDFVDYLDRGKSVNLSLDGQANDGEVGENDNILAVEKVRACNGPDVIVGSRNADEVFAEGSPDNVKAGPGDDAVNGGGGDDRLNGGPGTDVINGGGGEDTCIYNTGDKLKSCEEKIRKGFR